MRGRLRGLDGRLRVRWGDEPWVAVRARHDGRFEVRLRVERAGQGTLQVLSLSDPLVGAARPFVGVGDLYVIAGQSNTSGRSGDLSVYQSDLFRAGLFGNDYRRKELRDPVDSSGGQVDTVSRDWHGAGSVWPLVATELVAAERVPVAFIPCARGNVTMERWLRDPARPRSPHTLFGSLVRRVRAAGGSVRAAVGAPVVAAQIGDFSPTRYPPASVDAIRDATQRACDDGGDLVRGPSLYDIDLDGFWHVVQPDDKAAAVHRWAAAIVGGVLGGSAGTAPRLESAEYDGETAIDLRFTLGDQPLVEGIAGGFTVETAGRSVAVTGAVVSGPATVHVELGAPVTGPLTISLGKGRSGAGARVPVRARPGVCRRSRSWTGRWSRRRPAKPGNEPVPEVDEALLGTLAAHVPARILRPAASVARPRRAAVEWRAEARPTVVDPLLS